jgi:hypothetical protein
MLFFSLKGDVAEPVIFKDATGNPILRMNVVPTASEHVNENGIYCASIFDVRQIGHLLQQKYQEKIQIQIFDDSVIEGAFKLPAKLGNHVNKNGEEEQYGFIKTINDLNHEKNGKLNILFCNAFGNSFTDTYVSGNILREITKTLIEDKVSVSYEGTLSMAFPQPGMMLNSIHPLNNYFNSIVLLADLLRFDAYWSFSDLEMREGYEKDEYFSFFSKQFGLSKKIINNEFYIDKVTRIQLNNRIRSLKGQFENITTIQTSGVSLISSMPENIGKDLIENLCKNNEKTLFVSDNTFGLECSNLLSLANITNNIQSYIVLIENTDKVITVNSLTPILCKELSVPCVFVSTTIDPEISIGNNLDFEIITELDHDFTESREIYRNISEDELASVWSKISVSNIENKYNILNDKSDKNIYSEDIISGNDLLSKSVNPEL